MTNKDFLLDCVEWDTRNWSKALDFWENAVDLEHKNYECLELGGRRGGLSLWLASKGNNVICSDLNNPKQQASQLHEKHNLASRITYEGIDATDIPYHNHFDIVIFKSILGGISRDGNSHLNQVVLDQIFKALKPGGKLLFAENLKASRVHRLLRKRLVRWGSSWNYLDVNQLPALLTRFERVNLKTAGFLGAFGRTEQQRQVFGKLDTLLFDWSMGHGLKYIVFGVASKP
jgi:SAM-dependent methyltransferase